MLLPIQTAGVGGVTVTAGFTLTVTVIVSYAKHPPVPFPFTTYVIVVSGLAITDGPTVVFNHVPGDHEYELTPLALRSTVSPWQITGLGSFIVITGLGQTIMVLVDVEEQPDAVVPVTVYVNVEFGLELVVSQLVQLRPVEGLHI